MWELATQHINTDLYRLNIKLIRGSSKSDRLTAYPPYNEAYSAPNTPEIRKKLFASYEQLENKN